MKLILIIFGGIFAIEILLVIYKLIAIRHNKKEKTDEKT